MHITQLLIKNLRCFKEYSLQLEAPLVLLCGSNGSGKTSLLEAVHYGCYLRSFRTHLPRELIRHGQDTFFINIQFKDHLERHELQVGFSQSSKKRLVKINQRPIQTYKELTDHYRIITLTSDDLALIQEGPELRRTFIDQAIALADPDYSAALRTYKHIHANRNALLYNGTSNDELYHTWTQQLWNQSCVVQAKRQEQLHALQERTNALLAAFLPNALRITFTYRPRLIGNATSWPQFLASRPQLYEQERAFGRSLFGAHLDDIAIHFQDKGSKAFASRGQQKLIVFLLKVAQLQELVAKKGPCTLLVDDFMADFDTERIKMLLALLTSLKCQLILTSPTSTGDLPDTLKELGAQIACLTD
ncbi:MAG: DNA replication/repair protein RecF [Candidatus Babeliales bacterium]